VEIAAALMEYRGFEYHVVQTASPNGWKSTVDLPTSKKSRTGDASNKQEAVRRAESVIDKLVKAKSKSGEA
jgi:hypothetical protein